MSNLSRRRCRGRTCRAEILMVPTVTGKYLPVDADPQPDGSVVIEVDLLGEPYAQVVNLAGVQEATKRGVPLYMPHHATCPDVEEFRRA